MTQAAAPSSRAPRLAGLLLLALVPAPACISIPRESVELSSMLSGLTLDAKRSHVALTNAFFDAERRRVEGFFVNEYKAAYLAQVEELLGEQLSIDQYDQAMDVVFAEQRAYAAKLEAQRRKALGYLEETYNTLSAGQTELTQLLASAADLDQTRSGLVDRWSPRIGVSREGLHDLEDKIITRIDALYETLLAATSGPGGE